jgi:hypothetical protein
VKQSGQLAFLFFTILVIFSLSSSFFIIDNENNRDISKSDDELYLFVKEATPSTALFIVNPKEAEEFMYYTKHKTFADFSSSQSLEGKKRISTLNKAYNTVFPSVAVNTLNDYSVQSQDMYIVWKSNYVDYYGNKPAYLNSTCFPLVYENEEAQVYILECEGGIQE